MEKLELRTKPAQARSAATFDHILDTAIILLEADGWDGFSTNVLAQRAGVGIQTLYRYFPNKLSVVATLAQRTITEWNEWFADLDKFLGEDAKTISHNGFTVFINNLKDQPGGVAIRRAMSASPVLRDMDREDNRKLARAYSEAISRHSNHDNAEDFFYPVLTVIEASLAIVDLAFDLPEDESSKMINEFMLMQSLFFAEKVRRITRAGSK